MAPTTTSPARTSAVVDLTTTHTPGIRYGESPIHGTCPAPLGDTTKSSPLVPVTVRSATRKVPDPPF